MKHVLGATLGLSTAYLVALLIPTNEGLAIASFIGVVLGVSVGTWE